jgi:hypothetical protein
MSIIAGSNSFILSAVGGAAGSLAGVFSKDHLSKDSIIGVTLKAQYKSRLLTSEDESMVAGSKSDSTSTIMTNNIHAYDQMWHALKFARSTCRSCTQPHVSISRQIKFMLFAAPTTAIRTDYSRHIYSYNSRLAEAWAGGLLHELQGWFLRVLVHRSWSSPPIIATL